MFVDQIYSLKKKERERERKTKTKCSKYFCLYLSSNVEKITEESKNSPYGEWCIQLNWASFFFTSESENKIF